MKKLIAMLSACLISISASVYADNHAPISDIQAKMASFKDSLNLSDEQVESMSSILQQKAEQRTELLEQHGISMDSDKKVRLSIREKLALQKDMKKFRQSLESALSDVLSKEQFATWKGMQEESQKAFKEKLQAKMD